MKRLVFGTGNPAKLQQLKDALDSLPVVLEGLDGFAITFEVEEDGLTAQDNARKKATAYARAINLPVLSMDNALYLDGLAELDQPGTHVRRIHGSQGRPTDEELVAYYSKLIQSLGGQATGYWLFALALSWPDGRLAEASIKSPRRFTAQPSTVRIEGYPLESIQIDPDSGRYFSELDKMEQARLWQKYIGSQAKAFISENYLLD